MTAQPSPKARCGAWSRWIAAARWRLCEEVLDLGAFEKAKTQGWRRCSSLLSALRVLQQNALRRAKSTGAAANAPEGQRLVRGPSA